MNAANESSASGPERVVVDSPELNVDGPKSGDIPLADLEAMRSEIEAKIRALSEERRLWVRKYNAVNELISLQQEPAKAKEDVVP